jgi:hypothetical protein
MNAGVQIQVYEQIVRHIANERLQRILLESFQFKSGLLLSEGGGKLKR